MQDVRDNNLFSKLSVIGGGLLILIALGAVVYFSLQKTGYFLDKQNKDKNKVASVYYICNDKKTLTAVFFEPKMPTVSSTSAQDSHGSVVIKLDDGRNFDLNQTVYADGARYSNKDETFVFWNKGIEAMILEFDTERLYKGCKKYDPSENGYRNLVSYLDPYFNFTINYPKDYSQDKKYKYTLLGPDTSIDGVKFTIPKIYTDGNNLSKESYLSVENISNSSPCSASLFLSNVASKNISENGSDYSFASTTDAAMGQRYEEYVYAFPKNSTCFAVRYFIHYSAIENYTTGTVGAFNKDNLLKEFDAIRDSLDFVN